MKKEDISRFVADAEKRGWSRRDFIRNAARLGLAAPVAVSLFGASALAATPRSGGRFRHGMSGASTTDTLDPALTTDFHMQQVNNIVGNALTEVTHDSQVIGELAESWESSPDAKVWRFKLRGGVEFHDGRPLKAKDVIASINHHRGETQSGAKSYLNPVTDLRADGNTVVFTLESGNADFPFILSDYHYRIMPATESGGVDWSSGNGTGPFVIREYEPGVRFVGARNPNYWKSGRGHFDEVELLGINDTTARTNALVSDEIDAMNRCDLKTAHLLARNKSLRVLETTGTQHYTAPMLVDTPPFDNNDIRLALKYAVNRQEVLDKVLFGHGLRGNDIPITPANTYFNTDLPQREYDPERAKHHLKKAGVDGRLKVKLSAADAAFSGAVDAAILWQQSAKACGIDIDVVREPSDGYWDNIWRVKPWCMCFWSGRVTEDLMFTVAYAAGGDWNDSRWKHKRFNELLVAARSELDTKKRREMYYEMQDLCHNEGGVPTLLYANYVFANNNRVETGPNIASNWPADGHKSAERWWFGA